MQNEIKRGSKLLNGQGVLMQRGWSRHLILDYRRAEIAASPSRIKEWDYYCVLSDQAGISFTISDLGYIGFIGATVFDLTEAREISNSITTLLPLGKFKLPESSRQGNVIFQNKKMSLKFLKNGDNRVLEVHWPHFKGGQDLVGRIELFRPAEDDTMVIATPFAGKPHAFYYNQKINCMPASGGFSLGDRKFDFNDQSAWGVLDWGRGVWTYANTWYWASASARVAGKRFGLNLGYGFGDTSAASENLVFLDGRAHKLDQISFHIPPDDFLKPWEFSSNDGRLQLDFQPILDRHSNTNLLLIQSWQHQIFGRFSGQVILDDGTTFPVKDLTGFAEKVKNRW